MRSVSAFVKPSTAAIASTAKMATASGRRAARARRASQEIGRPRISRNATGEPSTQNQYGRIEATPARYTSPVARSVPIGSKPVAAANTPWTASSATPQTAASASAGRHPSRSSTSSAAHAPIASSDHANSETTREQRPRRRTRAARGCTSGHAASRPSVQ